MNTPHILGREPVLLFSAVQAVIAAVVAFGFEMTGEQVAAVELVTLAVLSLVVRQRVTPV